MPIKMRIKYFCISNIRLPILWLFSFFIIDVLSHNPYSNNWSVTRINTKKATYLWTINNYSLNNLKFKESLKSPIFSGEYGNEYQWQLALFPKGDRENAKDSVGLFVFLTNEANVTATFQFHIIDASGNKSISLSSTQNFLGANDNWGWSNVILQSELQEKAKNLLPDDSLTVLVEITVNDGITNFAGHCRFSTNTSTTEHMGILLENSFLSDVQLRVDGQLLKAHRAILATHSSWFLKEFTKNPNLDAAYIENTTIAAAKQALRFMYTGKVEIDEGNAEKLLSLSTQLGIPQLQLITEEVLCKSMKPTNAIDILKVAELHDAKNLSREVRNYIAAHANKVADSPAFEELEKSHPNPFYDIVRVLINKRKPEISSH